MTEREEGVSAREGEREKEREREREREREKQRNREKEGETDRKRGDFLQKKKYPFSSSVFAQRSK